jgi:hypothetical protein
MQINLIQLERTVEAANARAANHPAWLRAIEKAHTHLIENPYISETIENPYISETADGLLILPDSGETYQSNGTCQCKAFSYGQPCWHRAAAQLIRRYNEPVSPAVEREGAILVKRGGNVMRIDGWDV